MLLPAMLREAEPDLEIGFFLHIPWPSSEIFRLLPNREELMRGLLGAATSRFVLGQVEEIPLQLDKARMVLLSHPDPLLSVQLEVDYPSD